MQGIETKAAQHKKKTRTLSLSKMIYILYMVCSAMILGLLQSQGWKACNDMAAANQIYDPPGGNSNDYPMYHPIQYWDTSLKEVQDINIFTILSSLWHSELV